MNLDNEQGNRELLREKIHLETLHMHFTSKPILVGGFAMEYYGLRKHGEDIDFIITAEDYQTLAKQYPECKRDTWGDLHVKIAEYELLRSISRLDYDFYSKEALEFDTFKVISLERLFFMTAAAVRSEPEVPKRIEDFGLALGRYYELYRNCKW